MGCENCHRIVLFVLFCNINHRFDGDIKKGQSPPTDGLRSAAAPVEHFHPQPHVKD